MSTPTSLSPDALASHVLIVDDEQSICWGLQRLLTEAGHEVSVAASAEEALVTVGRHRPDLIVMDIRLPGMDGLSAMERIESLIGAVPIIVITAFGNLETAVAAVRNGAFDYLPKPFDLDEASALIRRALAHRREKLQPAAGAQPFSAADELLGVSPQMQNVFKKIALAAPTQSAVLITGESGTGKELVAHAIHSHSLRADRPLVPVNLASLSPTLVESELFGHVRGAFTGAESTRCGMLELADGATVFFDEAGDIPPSVQVKLLRVLEQHEVTPVGDTRARRSDFRVITATNRDLRMEFQTGGFRQDLYFRLAVFEITLPPLRDRREDIPPLVQRFLERMEMSGQTRPRITQAALAELCGRWWPGNVRELRNAVEYGATVARDRAIGVEHLPPPSQLASTGTDEAALLQRAVRGWARQQLEKRETQLYDKFLGQAEAPLFETVLEHTRNNRLAAADLLGLHRATLRKKLRPPK